MIGEMGVKTHQTAKENAASENTAFITVDKVAKSYSSRSGSSIAAVESLSFDVREGEFLSIVGPSGCGKSTLLKMVGGLLSPSEGKITYGSSGNKRPKLGVVFQDAVLLPWRNIFQNACLPLEVHPDSRHIERQRASDLLNLVGLKGFEDRYPFELSGGMQQRAAIARALVHEPSLLLMDEPFGALDALTREQMIGELERIWSATRKTVLFITHSVPEAVLLSDRVIVMTRRPSTIADLIEIDLPRPRSIEMMSDARSVEYSTRIRNLLRASGDL